MRILGTVTHVVTDKPVAALTFDDGPDALYTPKLLDMLGKYDAKATFFMVGHAASEHPDLVKKVYDKGHAIGNHTFNHEVLTSLSLLDGFNEVNRCRKALKPYGSRILRPPWGKQTRLSRCISLLLGYKVIAWSASAEDWMDLTPETMARKLHRALKPGCILLMHDRIYKSALKHPQYNRDAAIEALRLFLDEAAGTYRFVTVPQLLKQGRPNLKNWKRN
jgi:peptidoglycan-N-acetylglucosamine deacetylase